MVYGPEAESWILRCKTMPEKQVMAIYFKMKSEGKFDKRKKHVKTLQAKIDNYYQMTIFDYGYDL